MFIASEKRFASDIECNYSITLDDLKFQEALSKAIPITGWMKRLLPHELALYNSGELLNITHYGSSSFFLSTRRMNKYISIYLVEHGVLPHIQPYQAIIEGENGRLYANKYLTEGKYTDSNPTMIIEFFAVLPICYAQEKATDVSFYSTLSCANMYCADFPIS
jgi:hypothetical protein